jgi:hypothetical protein
MLGIDGLATGAGVGRGAEALGNVLGRSIPLGNCAASGGDPFGSTIGCSGFKGPSGRSGRSGKEMSSS